MVDTVRTRAQLLTASADNTSGNYRNQDLRDLIVTVSSWVAVFPGNYGDITDGGTFGDGLSHPASSNGFSTLAALQSQFKAASFTALGSGTNLTISAVTGAVYPGLTLGVTTGIGSGIKIVSQTSGTANGAGVYVTSGSTTISGAAATASWASATSNDMAGLMIQAAYHAAHLTGFGIVQLAAGRYYNLPQGFVFPQATNAQLNGCPGAQILCSPCGTNPAFSFTNQDQSYLPIFGIELWGTDSKQFGGGQSPGSANTGIFNSGSVAIAFAGCFNVVIRNLTIQNFDQAALYAASGTNYMVCWRDCVLILNNKAAVIDTPSASNSFERMSFDNCLFGSNNYNAYINFATVSGPIAADCNFFNCSFDYPYVLHLLYNNGNFFDLLSSVFMIGCHIETSSATTGTGNRINNYGFLSLMACYWFENGANPSGLIEYEFSEAAVSVVGCTNGCFSGSDASQVPWVAGLANANIRGYANSGRSNGLVSLLFKVPTGGLNSAMQSAPQFADTFTLAFYSSWDKPITMTATGTVTIPDFATTPFINGIGFTFFISPGVTTTFAPLNGSVHLTSSGVGLTAGAGGKPATVYLNNVTQDNWSLTGQMT